MTENWILEKTQFEKNHTLYKLVLFHACTYFEFELIWMFNKYFEGGCNNLHMPLAVSYIGILLQDIWIHKRWPIKRSGVICGLWKSIIAQGQYSYYNTVLTLKYGVNLLNASVSCVLRQNARAIVTATGSV